MLGVHFALVQGVPVEPACVHFALRLLEKPRLLDLHVKTVKLAHILLLQMEFSRIRYISKLKHTTQILQIWRNFKDIRVEFAMKKSQFFAIARSPYSHKLKRVR